LLPVRLIVGITLLVLGVGMLTCAWEGPAAHAVAQVRELRWVRTADGWERDGSWAANKYRPPSLHPLVWAAGQGLLSILALVACPTAGRREIGRQSLDR
jgi:hypothetical protein